ncbi:MAG: hypothetical protein CMJ83_00735 [Planctomycetes bacterium]|nr:hypothetical protein [Planctomycetota bacterium]
MPITEFGKNILVTVDLADDWNNVVEHAARFAQMSGAGLTLLHIIEEPSSSLKRSMAKKALQVHQQRLRTDAKVRVEEVAAEQRAAGVDCAVKISSGKASKEIVKASVALGSGLIVAGAGETEGSDWLFVGTTADRLIRNSKVPVLMVGRERDEPLKRILVPTDFDRADRGALKLASKIGREGKGRVSVFHTFAQPSILHGYSGNVAELRRTAKAQATKDLDEFVSKTKLPARAKPPHKLLKAHSGTVHAAEAIVSEASRLNMDLIVMALGGLTFLESFMIGAVAERVIRNLPCSLLALPTAWARKR